MSGLWTGVKSVAGLFGPTGRAIATGMQVAEGVGNALGVHPLSGTASQMQFRSD